MQGRGHTSRQSSGPSLSQAAVCCRRDNVALVQLLRPLQPSQAAGQPDLLLLVVQTHLLFNPKRGDIKVGGWARCQSGCVKLVFGSTCGSRAAA